MSELNNEIYVDRLKRVIVGYPMSKVEFLSVIDVGDDKKSITQKVVTITMPTASLVKTCRMILNNAEKDSAQLLDAAKVAVQNFAESLVAEKNLKDLPALEVERKKIGVVKKRSLKT